MSDLSTESATTAAARPRPRPSCDTCLSYFTKRARVLAPHIAVAAFAAGIHPTTLAARYVNSVHRRHLAGGSLDVPGAPR